MGTHPQGLAVRINLFMTSAIALFAIALSLTIKTVLIGRAGVLSLQELGLLMISVIASSFGQLFLKLGAMKLGEVTADNLVSHVLRIATTPTLIAGLAAYGVGAISYILLLTRVKLSVAAPSASLIYLASVLIGYFVFQESISVGRAIGLGLIVCGVALVASR
ncbi:MAG TPA: EamA-like transporter family protein [Trichocoleus sp.]